MPRSLCTIAGAVLALTLAGTACADVRLPALISDGMVLQRTGATIWGWADPGEQVSVAGDWDTAPQSTVADEHGRWRVRLPAPLNPPNTPGQLTVRGRNTLVVRNVLLGEVWLAAGQSNMQMPMGDVGGPYRGVTDWSREIASMNDERIRVFTVRPALDARGREDVQGSWVTLTPASARDASALGVYFARAIRQRLDTPVGVIVAAHAGAPLVSWCSPEILTDEPELVPDLAFVRRLAGDPDPASRTPARELQAWFDALGRTDEGSVNDAWAQPTLDDAHWEDYTAPGPWTGSARGYLGVVWHRRVIDVRPEQAGRDWIVQVGEVHDIDTTYFNGVRIGQGGRPLIYPPARSYRVPASLVRPGRNVLAVRAINAWKAGGITGAPMRAHPVGRPERPTPLTGVWKIRTGARWGDIGPWPVFRPLDADVPGAVYHAMIAPTEPMSVRGILWHQGESDRARAGLYERLFPRLITHWREQRGARVPVLLVELPPFHDRDDRGQSDQLRRAQRSALALPGTGMVSVSDIADEREINDPHKRPAAERLARLALRDVYALDAPEPAR